MLKIRHYYYNIPASSFSILLALEQFHSQIRSVQIVLRYAEVSAGDLVAAVIIDIHNHHRRHHFARPGMIAPGLAEAVASDFPYNSDSDSRRMDDAPRLNPADCFRLLPVTGENELAPSVREI